MDVTLHYIYLVTWLNLFYVAVIVDCGLSQIYEKNERVRGFKWQIKQDVKYQTKYENNVKIYILYVQSVNDAGRIYNVEYKTEILKLNGILWF